MARRPQPIEAMEAGFHKVARLEPRFAAVLRRHGEPPSRKRPGGFETVLKIIVQQQVSLASADAIWRRLRTGLGNVNPAAVLACDEDTLRAYGLSGAKVRYAYSLAEEVAAGRLNFRRLPHMADEEVVENLIKIKGIGRWTAEVYLLAVLQRPDVWPAGDVALMEGARDLLDLAERPTVKDMPALAEPWRPYRTYAARVIWLHYRHITNRGTIG